MREIHPVFYVITSSFFLNLFDINGDISNVLLWKELMMFRERRIQSLAPFVVSLKIKQIYSSSSPSPLPLAVEELGPLNPVLRY